MIKSNSPCYFTILCLRFPRRQNYFFMVVTINSPCYFISIVLFPLTSLPRGSFCELETAKVNSTFSAPTSAMMAVCVMENDLSPCVSKLTANHCRTRSSRELMGDGKIFHEICTSMRTMVLYCNLPKSSDASPVGIESEC